MHPAIPRLPEASKSSPLQGARVWQGVSGARVCQGVSGFELNSHTMLLIYYSTTLLLY